MIALLNYFFELCLLRAKPQDLPASNALFALTFAASLLTGVLILHDQFGGVFAALMVSLGDSLLLLAFVWFLLNLRGWLGRFKQSATALFGTNVLLALIAIPLLSMMSPEPSATVGLVSLLYLLLMFWSHVVTGHILRHALEVTLGHGILFAVLFTLVSTLLMQKLITGH